MHVGTVLERYVMRRGYSQVLIAALIRAAKYAKRTGKSATLCYHFDRDTAEESNVSITVESGQPKAKNMRDTLIIEVTPGMIDGDPPYPSHDVVQRAQTMMRRLYSRLYYRDYGRRMRRDPQTAPGWRAKRRETNRRYRLKKATARENSQGDA